MSLRTSLLTKGKVDTFTLSYVDTDGDVVVESVDDKEEVFMKLVDMKNQGKISMETVVVYPPNSNLTQEEFMAI